MFQRVIYTTVGTGIMGSLCFPEETSTVTSAVTKHSRHYINVAYNFFYGGINFFYISSYQLGPQFKIYQTRPSSTKFCINLNPNLLGRDGVIEQQQN